MLVGCDESHSIPDNYFKDKNWTIWMNEENNIAIYVASVYGAKNGVWISSAGGKEEKYLADMDSFLGISGFSRPWELKLTDTFDNTFQRKYDCKRMKNNKNDSSSMFTIETESESIVLKARNWKEEDIDINYLEGIGNRDLNLYCTVKVNPTNYSKGYCLEGTYLGETLLIKGEAGRAFVISYNNLTATGHYSREGDKIDFKFETNEIFESLDHIEFNC